MPKATVSASHPAAAASVAVPAGLPAPASYEAALQELETLVGRIESGTMPLDDVLLGYQRGAVLLGFCRDKLGSLEQQIKLLDGESSKAWTPE